MQRDCAWLLPFGSWVALRVQAFPNLHTLVLSTLSLAHTHTAAPHFSLTLVANYLSGLRSLRRLVLQVRAARCGLHSRSS